MMEVLGKLEDAWTSWEVLGFQDGGSANVAWLGDQGMSVLESALQ